MPDATAESYVSVKVSPDAGLQFTFNGLTGTEELGRPFQYDLDLSSDTLLADLGSLLGASATVTVTLPGSGKRHFNGIVTRASYRGLSGGAYRYRLDLRPWIWLLSRQRNSKIFQNMTALAIIKQIFSDAGFSDLEDKRQAQAGEITLEYCVQYDETALDFVTRLMERYGLYYFFSHSATKHTVILADDQNSHESVADALPYRYRETEQRRVDDQVWEWSADLRLQPGAVSLNDYNFKTSNANLNAKSLQPTSPSYNNFEVYGFPGAYDALTAGNQLAAIRMQDFVSRAEVLSGTSNARALYAGAKFTLTKHPDGSQNRAHLIVAATCTLEMAEGRSTTAGDAVDSFRISFTAIPGDRPYRLEPLTPKPTTRGPQTALVTGNSGEEITTDSFGRIKVQFFWDRYGVKDQNSSCWIRVAQAWAGAGWGSIFIPRIGMEVVVDFLDGDPDRPLVTGCVYNSATTVPYALPANQTRTTIMSNSSKGGSGFNELRLEDKAGSEEVFFHAQKDYNKVVLNNETVKITQDTTTTVEKGNRSVTVSKGNNSLTVSEGNNTTTIDKGNNSLTVSTGDNSTTVSKGNDSLTVSAGNHSIKVSAGTSTVEAAQSITLKVGGNSIVIDTSGVTINGTKIAMTGKSELTASAPTIGLSASGKLTANGGANMTLQAGMIAIN